MKYERCGHWNSIEVEKVILDPDSLSLKCKCKEEKCSKCGKVLEEEKS